VSFYTALVNTVTVTQYFNKECDKRTNSKERNKKRNRSNAKNYKKKSNNDLIINDCLCK